MISSRRTWAGGHRRLAICWSENFSLGQLVPRTVHSNPCGVRRSSGPERPQDFLEPTFSPSIADVAMALALGSLTTVPLIGLGGIRSCNPFLSLSTKRPIGVSLHLTSNQPTRVSSCDCAEHGNGRVQLPWARCGALPAVGGEA